MDSNKQMDMIKQCACEAVYTRLSKLFIHVYFAFICLNPKEIQEILSAFENCFFSALVWFVISPNAS